MHRHGRVRAESPARSLYPRHRWAGDTAAMTPDPDARGTRRWREPRRYNCRHL